MSNTLVIEGQIMYDVIKNIDTPKEALEKLSTLTPSMGWNIHPERARAAAYAIWLGNKKMDDFLAYYEKMIEFFGMINAGGSIDITSLGDIPDAPKGWIVPTPYLKGEIPKAIEKETPKKVVCNNCEKEMDEDLAECPHCGAIWCEGCETYVDSSAWMKDEERCNDCMVSAAEARCESFYDMD